VTGTTPVVPIFALASASYRTPQNCLKEKFAENHLKQMPACHHANRAEESFELRFGKRL